MEGAHWPGGGLQPVFFPIEIELTKLIVKAARGKRLNEKRCEKEDEYFFHGGKKLVSAQR
jgi:hypothetical protein